VKNNSPGMAIFRAWERLEDAKTRRWKQATSKGTLRRRPMVVHPDGDRHETEAYESDEEWQLIS